MREDTHSIMFFLRGGGWLLAGLEHPNQLRWSPFYCMSPLCSPSSSVVYIPFLLLHITYTSRSFKKYYTHFEWQLHVLPGTSITNSCMPNSAIQLNKTDTGPSARSRFPTAAYALSDLHLRTEIFQACTQFEKRGVP